MDLEVLLKESPTSQVRMLAEDLLSDGKVHTRREIVQYIREKGKQYRLEHFSDGCISGGIYQAVNGFGCEKVGSAKYKMTNIATLTHSDSKANEAKNIGDEAAELCEELVARLTVISREIDYVNADENEIKQLDLMRECISKVKNCAEKFRSCK